MNENDKIEVRISYWNHARLFLAYNKRENSDVESIFNQFLILGSFDFNDDSFNDKRKDAGIMTRHPDLFNASLTYFDKVWESKSFIQIFKFICLMR